MRWSVLAVTKRLRIVCINHSLENIKEKDIMLAH